MSYAIRGLMPRTDLSMGRHGFCIDLSAGWPGMVAKCDVLTQESVNYRIETIGNEWLDACGYNQPFDGKRLYEARSSIRVSWGEWGPEHISVPGNACGLDIDRKAFGALLPGGARLCPHNIDGWRQVQLLLIVFTEFANDVLLFSR